VEANDRAHVIIHGRVQGVCFRIETQRAARRLGVTGWVRNLSDGNVEAVMEGSAKAVAALLNWCDQGPRMARVDKVDVLHKPYSGEYEDFMVSH